MKKEYLHLGPFSDLADAAARSHTVTPPACPAAG